MENKAYRFLRPLTEGAVAVALAQALGYVSVFAMPYGETVTPGMAPLFLFAVRWGPGAGLLAGLGCGLLRLWTNPPGPLPWQALLAEYLGSWVLAGGAAGLWRRRKRGVFSGSVLGMAARWGCLVFSGVRFRPETMPERFLQLVMTDPRLYFSLYDGIWLSMCLAFCLALLTPLYIPFHRFFEGEDLVPKTE